MRGEQNEDAGTGGPSTDSVRSTLRLTLTRGLGPILIARLINRFGSAERVADATPEQLAQTPGIGRTLAREIADGVDDAVIEREIAVAASQGATILTLSDARYPPLLRLIPDPPPVLYVRGSFESDDVYGLAVVGTRRCSAYGRDQAGRLSAALAEHGFTIDSGGARGIDTESHRGALRVHGRTVAALGSGLARVYPEENAPLFDRIVSEGQGAVISEFPMETRPSKENFPRRNRIIAGLGLATLVIEAAEHSGALITARVACEDHNRDVMALPGRVDKPHAAGCHRMIREGWARLVTGVADIVETLEGAEYLVEAVRGTPVSRARPHRRPAPERSIIEDDASRSETPLESLSESQRRIVDSLDGDPVELDELAARTGLDIARLQADVTVLQIRGLITRTTSRGVSRR